MNYFKYLAFVMLLMLGQNTYADFASNGAVTSSDVAAAQAIMGTEKSITEPSTICSFSKDGISPKQTIEYNSFRAAFYLCDGDFAWNRIMEVFGNDSYMDNAVGLRNITTHYGSSKVVQGAQIISWILDFFLIFVGSIASIAALFSLGGFLYAKANPDDKDAQKYAHAPLALLWAIMCFTLPVTILKLVLLLVTLMMNYIGLQIMFFQLDKMNQDSDTISSTDSRTITAYSNTYAGLASSKRNTRLAQFAKGYSALANGSAAYYRVSNYNGEEFIADIEKYSSYDVDFSVDNSYAVGIDVTSDWKNIINSNIPVLAYNFYRKSPLLDGSKELLGHKSYLGSVTVNVHGTDLEDKTGDSINNDTFVSEVSAARKIGDEQNTFITDYRNIQKLIYGQYESGGVVDTVDFQKNAFLESANATMQDSIANGSEAATQQVFKPEELKFKLNTSEPYAKMMIRGSYLAGRTGHDRTGDKIQEMFDALSYDIDANLARAECTKHYAERLDQKKFVDAFNANKASGNIERNAKTNNDLLLPGRIDCIEVNYTLNRLDFLGSSDEKDVGHYNNKVLASKMAFDVVAANYIIGSKKAANKDKVAYNGLIADLLEMAKYGYLGTLGMVNSIMSGFISAEANRNAVLSNALVPSYADATSYESNHVSLDTLYAKVTDDNREKLQQDSFDQIPPQNYSGLMLSGFMKMTPARISDTSVINSQAFNNALLWAITPRLVPIYNMFGMDVNLSMREAAKACLDAPDVCNARVKTPLLQGLILTGMNMIDYGVGMLLFKGVTGVGVLGFDSMDSVIDKIQSASIGNSGVANTVGSLGKLFTGLVGKIAEVALRVTDIVLGMLVPLFVFYIIAGIFIGFILPLVTLLVIFNVVETLIMKSISLIMGLPIRSSKGLLLGKEDWWKEVKRQGNEIVALGAWGIFAAIYIAINAYLANSLDLSNPAWFILGNSDGSLVGGIVSIFAVLCLCIAVVWKLLTSPTDYANDTTNQIFGISISEKDDLIDRMSTSLNNPKVLEALQVVSQHTAHADKLAANGLKNKERDRANRNAERKSQGATGE